MLQMMDYGAIVKKASFAGTGWAVKMKSATFQTNTNKKTSQGRLNTPHAIKCVEACQSPTPSANFIILNEAKSMPLNAATVASPSEVSIPLCVDLDGTLIRSDVLWESLMRLLKQNPLWLLALPLWLLRGRAAMKKEIAARVELDPSSLPYHEAFLEFLKAEHAKGRTLILATAADLRLAQSVARHVGLFNDVIASDGQTNIRGKNKGRALAERYGKKAFDYAGNSSVDLPVWQEARQAIVVNASENLARRAGGVADLGRVFNEPDSNARALVKAMRPHQWVKNFIVFVPLITSHQVADAEISPQCRSGVHRVQPVRFIRLCAQ